MTEKRSQPLETIQDGELRVRFISPERADPVAIHGAFGGPRPDGTIVLHVYSEYSTVPNFVAHPRDGDSVHLGKTRSADLSADMDRIVQRPMSLSPHAARQLGFWLLQNADEAEKLLQANSESSNDDNL